jgi:hypothetical protein
MPAVGVAFVTDTPSTATESLAYWQVWTSTGGGTAATVLTTCSYAAAWASVLVNIMQGRGVLLETSFYDPTLTSTLPC